MIMRLKRKEPKFLNMLNKINNAFFKFDYQKHRSIQLNSNLEILDIYERVSNHFKTVTF